MGLNTTDALAMTSGMREMSGDSRDTPLMVEPTLTIQYGDQLMTNAIMDVTMILNVFLWISIDLRFARLLRGREETRMYLLDGQTTSQTFEA